MEDLRCRTTGMTRSQLDDAAERARDKWTLSVPGTPECEAALADLRQKTILLRRLSARMRRS